MVWIKMVTGKLAASYTANCMDEITAVQILEPVLIRVVSVGTTIELVRRRVFPTFLIMSILDTISTHTTTGSKGTYTVTLLIEHKRSNGPTSISTVTSLASNTDSGVAPAVLILSSGNGTGGHRHV